MEQPTILFVDDEQNILKSLSRLFMDEDYNLLFAAGGPEALALIESGLRPDVIVSDQRMPDMGGAEFLAIVREKLPESIRMILTGYADINAAVDAVNRGGIFRYILKPWNDDDLKLALQKALEHYELFQRNKRLTMELQEKNELLEGLNALLEEKVRLRTEELERKVRELEARDRIQQHLLAFHPLDETLRLILESVIDVSGLESAAIWLLNDGNGELARTAVLKRMEDGRITDDLAMQEETFRVASEETVRRALEMKKTLRGGHENDGAVPDLSRRTGVIPLFRSTKPLGVIVIECSADDDDAVCEIAIRSAESFGMQAAVAISDSRMHESIPRLESCLDAILLDFS